MGNDVFTPMDLDAIALTAIAIATFIFDQLDLFTGKVEDYAYLVIAVATLAAILLLVIGAGRYSLGWLTYAAAHWQDYPRWLVLQRQLSAGGIGSLLQGVEDPLPQAGGAPALVATVDRLPGAELRREIAPGSSRPHHPEHASEDRAVIMARAAGRRLLWRQERSNARPLRLGQLKLAGGQDLDRRSAGGH